MTTLNGPFIVRIDGGSIAPPANPGSAPPSYQATLSQVASAKLQIVNGFIESGRWYLSRHPNDSNKGAGLRPVFWFQKGTVKLGEAQKVQVQKDGNDYLLLLGGAPFSSKDGNVVVDPNGQKPANVVVQVPDQGRG
ncbi:hypothetical protein PT974_08065 [Cladobotryum mycophilum]|uniref:Uncharacterized protein n=1 Tax=Cladobotryum mycophilum TaxID=491253 RepID=A0ABR0SCB7_9HYPO